MENMCNESVVSGVLNTKNSEIQNEFTYERVSNNFSPRFGTFFSTNNVRCIPSPDDDIPSYQIPRGSQRFSDISEEQDSVLPISPVCTPPSANKVIDLEEPLIHTIGTIVKKCGDARIISNEESMDIQLNSNNKLYPDVFDELGILDKDISWNSSMETPAPHPLSLNDYNTIERATLLPEIDINNMHPRALFSPHKDDDPDCIPLKYSSESDDGDDQANSVQMSNDYETRKDITSLKEWKVNDTLFESPKRCLSSSRNSEKDTETKKEIITSPCSPVFRIRKKKKRSKLKNMRTLLVKSPVISENSTNDNEEKRGENYDLENSSAFNVTEISVNSDIKGQSGFFSEQSNSIQDDSFQDMSFSCIDELCKNSTCSTGTNTVHSKTVSDQDIVSENKSILKVPKLSLIKGTINHNKIFYESSEKSDELHPVPSADGFLKSAKRLEEGNKLPEKKMSDVFIKGEMTVFSKMMKEVCSRDFPTLGVKRNRCENYPEKSIRNFGEVKMIKVDKEREEQDLTFEESKKTKNDAMEDNSIQFDANDSQMCRTAALAEKLSNCSDYPGNSFTKNENEEIHNKKIECNYPKNEVLCNIGVINENSGGEQGFPMFSTALGNSVSVSNDALKRVRNIFKEVYEENDVINSELSKIVNIDKIEKNDERGISDGFHGFKTASGAAVKISEQSLNKVKNLFNEFLEENVFEIPLLENSGFATASGKKLDISEDSLDKTKTILTSADIKSNPQRGEEEFKKIGDEPQSKFGGFKTASNKKVDVSKNSLRKVQALWKGEEEVLEKYFGDPEDLKIVPRNRILDGLEVIDEKSERPEGPVEPVQKFCGFSTASGKNVYISNEALLKAKKVLGEESVDEVTISSSKGEIEDCGKKLAAPSPDVASEKEKMEVIEEDFDELIPDWLHAYNTSPNLTMDRLQVSAVTCHEDCQQQSTPREQYIVKSPILGMTDRFYNKRKRRNPGRKLIFEPLPKLEAVKEIDFKPSFNLSCENHSSKRVASDMNIDFAVPFKRRKLNVEVDDFITKEVGKLSEEIKEGRRLARLDQLIAGKKAKVKPITGSLLLKKNEAQVSWREAVQGALPEVYSQEILLKNGIREDVLAITSSNAADYKFKSTDFFTKADSFSNVRGFTVGDGCSLIFDDDNLAGIEEFSRAFFASPGVEPSLISLEWIKNHYKWIVWKFSHYERAFPQIFGGKCLTPHNVLIQLKYRYDREVDRSHRSALKKILERDDSSAKKIVLCVSDIRKSSDLDNRAQGSSMNKSIITYKLGLSDGWYSCYAQTDSAMTKLISEGKVFVGTKLFIQGAELLNCDEGVSPLEAGESIHLKISTNSTRRARWDVKLGFQKNGNSLLVPLNSILPNGGLVSRVDVIIVRIYPILYMEKNSDGTHVTRNSRMEDKAAAAYQQQQEAALEKIYQVVKDELRNKGQEREKQIGKFSMLNISEVVDGEELYRYYENCSDPSSFQSLLTSKQKEILIDHQRRRSEINHKEVSDLVQERIKAEKINPRKVSQLLKIKIVDLNKPNFASPALLTIWNLKEDVSRIFSEGKAISIYNAAPGNSRCFNIIQLNSTRQTRYKELSQYVDYPARKVTNLKELCRDHEFIFNEVDIVGMVIVTHETSFGSRLSQTIYISDENFNFAGIVFWGHCKDFGWENILTVGSVVACSNLHWNKRKNSNNIPYVYVNDTSAFTENPKQNYFREEIKRLKTSLLGDKKSFISKCTEEISTKLEDCNHNSSHSKNSSLPNDSSLNLSSNLKPRYINGFKTKPNASSTPLKSVDCLGLDISEQEPSPIQKRIEKLQIYGEPPPLSPLLPLDNLEKFKTKFRVPFKNSFSPDSSSK